MCGEFLHPKWQKNDRNSNLFGSGKNPLELGFSSFPFVANIIVGIVKSLWDFVDLCMHAGDIEIFALLHC